MNGDAYTMILTQGVHVVRGDVARIIRDAINEGHRTVDIDVDLFGGPDSSRRTMIVTAHVVALVEAKQTTRSIAAASNGKVRLIR